MPDPYDEEESDRLYEAHLAWVKEMPLVAARKAKGKHANPQDDDPCIARLKRDMLLVEKALPRSAFMEDWDSAAWKDSVRACTQPSEFREALANLESSILDEFVSPYYRKWPLLVRGAWLPTGLCLSLGPFKLCTSCPFFHLLAIYDYLLTVQVLDITALISPPRRSSTIFKTTLLCKWNIFFATNRSLRRTSLLLFYCQTRQTASDTAYHPCLWAQARR